MFCSINTEMKNIKAICLYHCKVFTDPVEVCWRSLRHRTFSGNSIERIARIATIEYNNIERIATKNIATNMDQPKLDCFA